MRFNVSCTRCLRVPKSQRVHIPGEGGERVGEGVGIEGFGSVMKVTAEMVVSNTVGHRV